MSEWELHRMICAVATKPCQPNLIYTLEHRRRMVIEILCEGTGGISEQGVIPYTY